MEKLLQGLPQLSSEDRAVLDANFSLEEISAAAGQLAPAQGGLPADFCKRLLLASSHHVGLSLLPKKQRFVSA